MASGADGAVRDLEDLEDRYGLMQQDYDDAIATVN
jgi:hypothetical protein